MSPAFCLLIGIALFLFLFWLQNRKPGFWITGTLLSLFWAGVFGFFAWLISGEDLIWGCVVTGLGFLLMAALYLNARGSG
ncbi:MAG: hypothetical protein LBQ15_01980 [Clostridium sp.]|nr:hypothetical protein [Clostridium sp.]